MWWFRSRLAGRVSSGEDDPAHACLCGAENCMARWFCGFAASYLAPAPHFVGQPRSAHCVPNSSWQPTSPHTLSGWKEFPPWSSPVTPIQKSDGLSPPSKTSSMSPSEGGDEHKQGRTGRKNGSAASGAPQGCKGRLKGGGAPDPPNTDVRRKMSEKCLFPSLLSIFHIS